ARPDRRQVPALGAHDAARAAVGHRARADHLGLALADPAARPLARGGAGGGARWGQIWPRARTPDVAVARGAAVGARDVDLGGPERVRLRRAAHARARARARHAVLHGPSDVVADHRPAAARAP